jgi:hypothetical protein
MPLLTVEAEEMIIAMGFSDAVPGEAGRSVGGSKAKAG